MSFYTFLFVHFFIYFYFLDHQVPGLTYKCYVAVKMFSLPCSHTYVIGGLSSVFKNHSTRDKMCTLYRLCDL